jgi:hypothetical protein
MMQSGIGRRERDNMEPNEIEALLPWYAAGTLRQRDRQRVEEALRQDPELVRQLDLVREEFAETIHLNETLGAPSPRVADRLRAAIDAEAPTTLKRAPGAAAGWLTGFFASLSPRTMAVAASFATLVIGLQAVLLADVLTRPAAQPQSPAQSPGPGPVYRGLGAASGSFAMVRFARQASAGDITSFLQHYQATVVDGPTMGGVYRVRVAMNQLAKGEVARIVEQMRQDRVVEYAAANE